MTVTYMASASSRATHGRNKDENIDNAYVTQAELVIRRRGIHCPRFWAWDEQDKSREVSLSGINKCTATFHPHWSNGTAGVRATQAVGSGVNYWEIEVGDRVFGTSLMFGVSTKQARLHAGEFKNMLGEDDHGWALSHRGALFHKGESRNYCDPFAEYTPVTVGILLDMNEGTLSYFKNGVSLGVAFTGLNKVEEELFPTICSTAAKTVMYVGRRCRSFFDLRDMCRQVIIQAIADDNESETKRSLASVTDSLPVPELIKRYLRNVARS